MKRPKKMKYIESRQICDKAGYCSDYCVDKWNNCYGVWEKYHNWRMGQLPSENEIIELLNSWNNQEMSKGEQHDCISCGLCDIGRKEIARTISNRLKGIE